ncbi:MAG TPA: ABC transporter permease [Gemmatimonadaceae bacterium]|nr:ABC transporter permease [Gemmatimonadaceae bacterium]
MRSLFPAAVVIGLDALRTNRLRTLLSTLGVIIGVASLVAVLSLGDGMERMARAEIERTTDVQTVSVSSKTSELIDGERYPVRGYPIFTLADARDADDQIIRASAVSLVVTGSATIESPITGGRRSVGMNATLADADRFMSLSIAEGRYFTPSEEARGVPVVVLSNRLARELARGRSPDVLLQQMVNVNGTPHQVIGILAAYEGERLLNAYIPFSRAHEVLRLTAASQPPVLLVRARALEEVRAARADVEDWIAERYGQRANRVLVQTSDQRLAQATQGVFIFKLFMGAITGISLLVGGIGIMNVLLASVTERTREIGVRKAAGARRIDIVMQFLVESVVISGLGSLVGVALGLSTSFAVVALIRARARTIFLDATFSWSTVLVSALAAIAVGLIFGTYPARRAGRLSPIDAIRHE